MICNFLIFDNLGSRYDPYMGYSGLHRRILLSHFFKKWKNLPKVHVLWPILFQILYWSFFCSPFWSNQVPPTQKNSKNCRKHPFDTLGTSFNQSGATIRGRKMQLSRRLMGGQGRRIFWWYFQLAPMTHSPWVMSHENGAGHFRSLPVFSFRSILFQILSGSFFTKRFGSIWYHLRII